MEDARNNCYVSAILVIAAIVALIYSKSMSASARKYPMFILGLVIIFGLALFIISFYKIRKNVQAYAQMRKGPKTPVLTLKEWGMILIAVVYAVAMRLIGFLPASLILFICLSIYVGYRKWIQLGVIAVCSVATIYYIFFRYLTLSYIDGLLFR